MKQGEKFVLGIEAVAVFGGRDSIQFLEEAAEVKFIGETETFCDLFDFQVCADDKLDGLLVEPAIQIFLGEKKVTEKKVTGIILEAVDPCEAGRANRPGEPRIRVVRVIQC